MGCQAARLQAGLLLWQGCAPIRKVERHIVQMKDASDVLERKASCVYEHLGLYAESFVRINIDHLIEVNNECTERSPL